MARKSSSKRGDVPVARLVPIPKLVERKAGAFEGQIWMADDFDELPPEFDEYMR